MRAHDQHDRHDEEDQDERHLRGGAGQFTNFFHGAPFQFLHSEDELIRRREFATVRRGYDPDQVREYLASRPETAEGEFELPMVTTTVRAVVRG